MPIYFMFSIDMFNYSSHNERGIVNICLRYTERLTEANIDASVGSISDSYDNALAE